MTRDARAAKTLISELEAVVGHVEVERDDLDGLGVYRTYRITSDAYKGLADVVDAVADERIVSTRSLTKGVEVTFHSSPRFGDGTDPFSVIDATDLLTKKRPAKKAAAPPKDD